MSTSEKILFNNTEEAVYHIQLISRTEFGSIFGTTRNMDKLNIVAKKKKKACQVLFCAFHKHEIRALNMGPEGDVST